jgi:formylglycine-generating enzyme required for sulfatase activity
MFVVAILATVVGAKKMTKEELPSEAVHFAGGSYKIGGCEKCGAPWNMSVEVKPFFMDVTAVSNKQFRAFVRKTKFR